MSFWRKVREFFAHPIRTTFGRDADSGAEPERADVPPETPHEPPEEPQYEGGGGGDYSWQLAGWVMAGQSYDPHYHNVDPDSPEKRFGVEPFPGWGFLTDVDYVVIKVHADGDTFYTTIGGPFNDVEDLERAIQDWYDSGS